MNKPTAKKHFRKIRNFILKVHLLLVFFFLFRSVTYQSLSRTTPENTADKIFLSDLVVDAFTNVH